MSVNNHQTTDKIRDLDQLAEALESVRAQGRRIVHCHGVFDPMHIGHIRHFEQAKKMGDVLVVTITPDHYVNKGPHRPVFSAELRAEAIAALDTVDHVAINRWPTAVEAIQLLKPGCYVKGSDYENPDDDQSGGIKLERDAVESMGGRIEFTNDITFSSSALVNRYLPVFSPEVSDYLARFNANHSSDEVLGYVQRAQSLKVLVVGEAIIDEYQYCQAIGKSSKEPMLAVKQLAMERFAGGIMAVGNHVANFSDTVGLISILGDKNSHQQFVLDNIHPRITKTLLCRKDAPTIVKRRFIEEYFFTKLLEVYEINDEAPDAEENEALCAALEDLVPRYDVVIVADFGHGMLTDEAIGILCAKAKFLVVNAQANAGNLGYHSIYRYPRADFICTAENEIRLAARNRYDDLENLVLEISQHLRCGKVIVTRGARGCLCYSTEDGFVEIPALAGQVTDRMGAGDAFLSVASLCMALDTPLEVTGFIGNAVGAQAVATVGNRKPVERVPLIKHIQSLMK